MRRRQVLAGLGLAATPLAGCATVGPKPDLNETPPTAFLDVSLQALQPAVASLATDSLTLHGDGQYLFLNVSVADGPAPSRSDFRFQFDGETHTPSEASGATELWRLYDEDSGRYDATSGAGWMLFELPATDATDGAALLWEGGEWTPEASLRGRLAAPAPSLSVEWTVPATAPVDAEPTVEFAVTNEGAVAGHFVAGLNRTGPMVAYTPVAALSRPVPAGETVSWGVTDEFDLGAPPDDEVSDGEADATYRLRLPDGSREQSVRLVKRDQQT